MIPDEKEIETLWKRYHLPPNKRIHCEAVANVAMTITKHMNAVMPVNEQLLLAAALLHDIDKNIEKFPGEKHPDAVVRILKKEGMDEVAEVIRTHPLHMICNENTAPKTIEQQLLFLADKMTKRECVGINKRFLMWKKEDYDEESQAILDVAYPKVLKLRDEILRSAGISEEELIRLTK
jgi:putative nucleotidyltransferase with HDIG domain